MDRLEHFNSLSLHSWLGRVYKKLTTDELGIAKNFIRTNSGLDKGAFEVALNRMFLDTPNKPKHFKEILELLACANSALK